VTGDLTRGLLGAGAGFFPMFNRNKKSVAIDLRSAQGLQAAIRLASTADVVVQNFKPGVMKKYGLDYAHLSQLNPGLIYVNHTGFLPGPYEHRTALDEVVQMMGGLAHMTGRSAACWLQRERHHGRHVWGDWRSGRADAAQPDR
jgi:crotonobetainyl-CoA:carnitine CoA-transferase CaiB-like acyl-CoA transferase